jgi:hypothetical protein
MKPARKREMVDHVRAAWQVSIRRVCRAVQVDCSTYHYRSNRAGQAPLAKRIREIAETRVRWCAMDIGAFKHGIIFQSPAERKAARYRSSVLRGIPS